MPDATAAAADPTTQPRKSWYARIPLYLKILIALILGVAVGEFVSPETAKKFNTPAVLILRLLGAIAPPLILVAVMRSLLTANVKGRLAGRLFFLLVLNTLVAILIGLLVANVIRPGRHANLRPDTPPPKVNVSPFDALLDNIPDSLLRPLVDNKVIGVIIVAVALSLAARKFDQARRDQILAALEVGFDLILILLHWIIALVPLAVFCKVAYVIGTAGWDTFKALGWFIVAVLIALLLQAT
jgi:DAACS family dicarboxylate/amino acid:cation (Na+ or H+) symporter